MTADRSRGLWRQAWSREWTEEKSIDDESRRILMAVQPEDDLTALALATMIYARWPFRDGVHASKLSQRLADDSVKAFQGRPNDRQKLFETMTPADMTGALLDSVIAAVARSSKNVEQLGNWRESFDNRGAKSRGAIWSVGSINTARPKRPLTQEPLPPTGRDPHQPEV